MAGVYRIEVKRPRPSMQSDDVNFYGPYEQAVALARRFHNETGRAVHVYDETGSYWWHECINGVSTDRNIHAGDTVESMVAE